MTVASIKSDFFTVNPKNYRIKGAHTGKAYQLGDVVKIKLMSTDL